MVLFKAVEIGGWDLVLSDDTDGLPLVLHNSLIQPLIQKRSMGAYKYIGELYKKKQSDVLRFLLRVRSVMSVDQ